MFVSFLENVSHYCFMRWGQKFRKCIVSLRWDHQTNSQYNMCSIKLLTRPFYLLFYDCLRVPVNDINRLAYIEWPPKSAGNDTNRFHLHKVVIQNRLFQHGRRVYITTTKPYTFMFCETAMNQLVYIYLYDWTPL